MYFSTSERELFPSPRNPSEAEERGRLRRSFWLLAANVEQDPRDPN